MPPARPEVTPTVLVDEYFASGDERFLAALATVSQSNYLAGLADRWKADPRPWARRAVIDYLERPLDRPGHNVIVKRLFKQAEGAADTELMACFLVAFDRLVRRKRVVSRRYDFNTGTVETIQSLKVPSDALLPPRKPRKARNPMTGEVITISTPPRESGTLFSVHTRAYLRRRVWRYFRTMGHRQPADYVPALTRALALYRDDDLAEGENILDNWSLMNALFHSSGVVRFAPPHVSLVEGRSLSELAPSPRYPDLWRAAEAIPHLFDLLLHAPARLVRVWAAGMLREFHPAALDSVPVERLVALLESQWPDVQTFGAQLLSSARGLESLPVRSWLRLLETGNLEALELIAGAMKKHVLASRLTAAECVALACARPAPVARLGFVWLQQRDWSDPADRAELIGVTAATCPMVARELGDWALPLVGAPGVYQSDTILRFFDSLNRDIRLAACDWTDKPESPGHVDPELWSRIVETPYEEIRLWITRRLASHAAEAVPRLGTGSLLPIWSAVLLGIHRGGREKQASLRRLAAELLHRPESAAEILPVLAVAVRSIRGPERRAGLAAIATATAAHPQLHAEVARQIPELTLHLPEDLHA